ncbi:MAG: hypothetical protein KDK76_03835 [Chlamydiia bacterium]|nr:hypothetical protein [Chlamydiia bacterium]
MKHLLFLLIPCLLFTSEPFFTFVDPPKEWLISDPSKYEEGVKVAFIASKQKVFTPSITLTIENVGKATMDDYVQALKRIYQADEFQELGIFTTSVGVAHLFQIDRNAQWGQMRLLQAITLYKGHALIQTGACLKKDFLDVHETFLNTFKSLQTTPSLLTTCNHPTFEKRLENITKCWKKLCATSKDDKKTLFNSPFFQDNQWKPFVSYIEKELKEKGLCWQFLALKYIQESLLTENKP